MKSSLKSLQLHCWAHPNAGVRLCVPSTLRPPSWLEDREPGCNFAKTPFGSCAQVGAPSSPHPRVTRFYSELLFICHRGLVLVGGGDSGRGSHSWGQDRPHLRLRPRYRAHLCIRGVEEQEVVQRRSHSGHPELEVDHGGGEHLSGFNFLMPSPPPSFSFLGPSRLRGRCLLCPTTAAACSEGNCLC